MFSRAVRLKPEVAAGLVTDTRDRSWGRGSLKYVFNTTYFGRVRPHGTLGKYYKYKRIRYSPRRGRRLPRRARLGSLRIRHCAADVARKTIRIQYVSKIRDLNDNNDNSGNACVGGCTYTRVCPPVLYTSQRPYCDGTSVYRITYASDINQSAKLSLRPVSRIHFLYCER